MSEDLNGYQLSRNWFDFCFENPEKIHPNHTAIFFFAIEHCNRMGWKKKFRFPTSMAMEAIGIKSYNTYIKSFRDLVDWGFITLIQKSKNQYSSNIIALSKIDKAPDKALDKAFQKHGSKQRESTSQSNDSNNIKQGNKGTREQEEPEYEEKYCYGCDEEWDKKQPIDYTSFVDAFNEMYDRSLHVTDQKREMIRGRLRTFTGEEIKKAWKNRFEDDWLNGEGSKFLGDWKAAMRNDEKIDKYLNLPEESDQDLLDNNPLRKLQPSDQN